MKNSTIRRLGQVTFGALLATLSVKNSNAGFAPTNNPAAPKGGLEAVAEEILVRFKTTASVEDQQAALDKVGGRIKALKRSPAMAAFGEPPFAKVGTHLPIGQAVNALADDPAVELAEPNYIYQKQQSATFAANDYFYSSPESHARQYPLWGVYGSSANAISGPSYLINANGSQADEGWVATAGVSLKEVVVGIIDEGVSTEHPELKPNIWVNPGETGLYKVLLATANNVDDDKNGVVDDETYEQNVTVADETTFDRATDKVDNDKNGYIDDVNGWDFFHNDNSVFDKVAHVPDADSHGTHVAGTIGAKANNGYGVAGVHPNVKMIPAKFLGPDGGDTADAIEAIDYFIDLKINRGVNNLVAINNSWGGGGYSALLHSAIIRAAKVGILFVAAAGNGNAVGIGQDNDRYASYPASYDTTQIVVVNGTTFEAGYDAVISVAAIDSRGSRAGFSNYGAKSVDLAAPGVNILSTYPWNVDHLSTYPTEANAREWCYVPMNGTSMATPHVTGAAALYAAYHTGASPAAIKKALLDKTVYTSSMSGRCVSNGRLNLARITESPVEPASKPLNFKAGAEVENDIVSKGKIVLHWEDSLNETAYELQRSTSASFSKGVKTLTAPAANSTTAKDTGLTSGSTYYYRLRAISANGSSVYATTSFRAP